MADTAPSRPVDPSRFPQEPELMMWQPRWESLAMSKDDVAEIQITALRKRFADLRSKLPVLDNLACEQKIDHIEDLNAAAPLLFKHSVYKSYPVSLIEKNRFDRLTAWLGNLTTADLSVVDTTGIETIDDWLDAVYRDAGVRIIHSTGTSGKLSFFPKAQPEVDHYLRAFRLSIEDKQIVEDMEKMPIIAIGHRKMYNGYGAVLDVLAEKLFDGDESMILALYPGRLSADVLSLGGRLSAAAGKGGVGPLPPALLARRDRFVEEQKNAPAARAAFFEKIFGRLLGQRVMMSANWIMLRDIMVMGREKGIEKLFAPDSRISIAGGTKGETLPDGFKEAIYAFMGADDYIEAYGMTELSTMMLKCSAGKYHAVPWIIVYVIDPDTGEPAPREGTHTGRFGAIDLIPKSYWGGILTGDEVTVTFGRCACGQEGPFIEDGVRRFSETRSGDDKITCAGAPEAHDKALAFLTEMD